MTEKGGGKSKFMLYCQKLESNTSMYIKNGTFIML